MAKRYGMVIDTKRCIGCNTCAVACKVENNLPNNVWWNRAMTIGGTHPDTPAGEFPNLNMEFLTLSLPTLREPCLRESVPCWRNL